MSDLISRKQAIDACLKYNGYGSVWACIMGDIKQLPSVTIKGTADKIKVTNCNDNISRQAICDALDKAFADRIKMFDYDSYEKADEKTQLVCDGIMRAIDVVLGQPTVDHLAEVSKKGDLISREDALNCFHDWIDQRGDVHTADEMPEYQRIEQLPSAQPETNCSEFPNNSDTISRQAAIDAIDDANDSLVEDDYTYGVQNGMEKAKYVIEALPSAQPEIIRCKDCKWFDCDWHQCRRQVCASFYMDDYCSEAERRSDE